MPSTKLPKYAESEHLIWTVTPQNLTFFEILLRCQHCARVEEVPCLVPCCKKDAVWLWVWSPGFGERWPGWAVPFHGDKDQVYQCQWETSEMQIPGPVRLAESASGGQIQQSLCLYFLLSPPGSSEAWSVNLAGDFSTLAQLLSWLCPGRCPWDISFLLSFLWSP